MYIYVEKFKEIVRSNPSLNRTIFISLDNDFLIVRMLFSGPGYNLEQTFHLIIPPRKFAPSIVCIEEYRQHFFISHTHFGKDMTELHLGRRAMSYRDALGEKIVGVLIEFIPGDDFRYSGD